MCYKKKLYVVLSHMELTDAGAVEGVVLFACNLHRVVDNSI